MESILLVFFELALAYIVLQGLFEFILPAPKKEKKKENFCKECGSYHHKDDDTGFYFQVMAFHKYPQAKSIRENLATAA